MMKEPSSIPGPVPEGAIVTRLLPGRGRGNMTRSSGNVRSQPVDTQASCQDHLCNVDNRENRMLL